VNYKQALNIHDLRRIAQRRLPRVAWEFLERGTEDETTLAENRAAFERIRLRPRALVDVSKRTQQVTVFDRTYRAPLGIAPTGAAGLYSFEADVALARAAAKAGVPFVLSTASFVALERVAREADGSKWFQLYMSKDRDAAQTLVARARDAGFEALVVTTDVPVGGNREYNRRNRFDVPFRLNFRNALDGALHPHWLVNVFMRTLLTSGVPRFRNTDVGGRIIARNLLEFRARREALDWSDFDWLREFWPGKLLVKGVLTVEDALLAVRHGADGLFVSNHGARQLDGAPAPLDVLPEIAAAVGGRIRIMLDSGVRRGSDIVKALALGADMVFVGRAALYGASAGGEAGVTRALDILKSEVDRVMALIGCPSVEDLHARYLAHGDEPEARRAVSRC
ncbi:MAG TPA: alpha-hydroxy acid oxidase, partial [Burkholderiales bacterium]|nr:alpha-hydroxy acid oxidase [Burkholderiales bacterium]